MKTAIFPFLLLMFACLLGARTASASPAEPLAATLKNGLRVVVVRNTLAHAVSTQLDYLVGSDEAPPGFPGMAHAQEHMMFRGTPDLTPAQMSAIIAAMGGQFNADTQQMLTRYVSTVAAEDLEAVLRLEASRMRAVLDSPAGWDQERGAIIQEVEQDLSDPQYLLSVKLLEAAFTGSPYAQDALGTRPSFEKTSASMLRDFHRTWYAPNNAVLIIVGDVDPKAALALAKKHFEPIAPRKLPARPSFQFRPLRGEHFTMESDLPYGVAVVAYRLPGFDSPDYAAGEVLSDVLSSKRGNLFALVPAGKALSADFESMPLPKAALGYAMAAYSKEGAGPGLIAALKQVLKEYAEKGVPPELVEAAKRHEIADLEFQKNSIEELADAWTQAVAVEGRKSPQDDIEAIKQVTAADVNRVARRYLENETAITAILTPHPSGKPVAAKPSPRSKESFTPESVESTDLPPWARKLTQALPGAPHREKPAQFTLPNGLRLIVVPIRNGNTVSLYGMVKTEPDLETPPGQEGVDEVLGSLFAYGTRNLDRLKFEAALDDIAASMEVGDNFGLKVLKPHLDRGVELLAENLIHPALPADAFAIVRGQTAEAVAGRRQSAGWLAEYAMHEALYPKKDPSLREPTPESVSALTLDDVRNYHRTVFRPDLTTIVAIGAITPEETRQLILKHFGNWHGEGPKPPTDLQSVPANAPSASAVPDQSRIQDEVLLEETLGLTRSHPDYYPLQVGLHVLSGGFYATRLYQDLRERTGLVYTVEAMLNAGKTRTTLGVYYGCEPANVGKARVVIERDIEQMQRKPVSEPELMQSKTLLLRQILLSQVSTRGIAEELLHFSQLDLPLDEAVHAAKRYAEIKALEVQKAFQKWLRPAGFAQVSRGPAP
ncbi:M16 family metallopeptidase [Geomesophilobacter sediminis]|uniref:Insulinase family protein n=1 Tax=Geomesophilobacter sediminis TaxID=2798584 RepID=A0A8J7M1U2_9BACT|nr:pitrilysin family protein [Geomesophilobacter sediminis]MBJ6727129.1 insulinase family protein [Geomesophilobacter sediminis]